MRASGDKRARNPITGSRPAFVVARASQAGRLYDRSCPVPAATAPTAPLLLWCLQDRDIQLAHALSNLGVESSQASCALSAQRGSDMAWWRDACAVTKACLVRHGSCRVTVLTRSIALSNDRIVPTPVASACAMR